MGFRQITKIDQDGQKLALVEIEAWQLVVTAVDCKAFAIADGSCEIGAPYWSDPARAYPCIYIGPIGLRVNI